MCPQVTPPPRPVLVSEAFPAIAPSRVRMAKLSARRARADFVKRYRQWVNCNRKVSPSEVEVNAFNENDLDGDVIVVKRMKSAPS